MEMQLSEVQGLSRMAVLLDRTIRRVETGELVI